MSRYEPTEAPSWQHERSAAAIALPRTAKRSLMEIRASVAWEDLSGLDLSAAVQMKFKRAFLGSGERRIEGFGKLDRLAGFDCT